MVINLWDKDRPDRFLKTFLPSFTRERSTQIWFCGILQHVFSPTRLGKLWSLQNSIIDSFLYILFSKNVYNDILGNSRNFVLWWDKRSQVFYENAVVKKNDVSESHFNKVAGLHSATLFKKRLRHKCFNVNFAKFTKQLFFRTPPGN